MEETCYLRVKVRCSKDKVLEVMLGAGDAFTDSVFTHVEETTKCLKVPCSMPEGKVSGDVAIVGNEITTEPGYLKDTLAYTSEEQCLSEQMDHFEVSCEGDQVQERREEGNKLMIIKLLLQ